MARLSAPDKRTTPKPPRPMGVAMATMVSWIFMSGEDKALLRPAGRRTEVRRSTLKRAPQEKSV
jgi:hypothetical protein